MRCGKKRFKDQIDAKIRLLDMQRVGQIPDGAKAEECSRCRGWHLTTKAA